MGHLKGDPWWRTLTSSWDLVSCVVLSPLLRYVAPPPHTHHRGSGDSSVVRASDSRLKGPGFESLQKWRESFLLQGPLSVPTYFGIRSTPCVTAVARKRPSSFCQKRRWQVTAKHACTLRMWLCMKWHGAWLYGVHRTCWDGCSFMWHQPCERC